MRVNSRRRRRLARLANIATPRIHGHAPVRERDFFSTRTNGTKDQTGEKCDDDEARVPSLLFGHRRQAHEHEDDRLHDARRHFQDVFNGGHGFLRDIVLDVLFHHLEGRQSASLCAPTTHLPCRK